MTTAARHTNVYLALAAVVVLSTFTAAKAVAGDTAKVLGAIAAGYIAYELLDNHSSGRTHYTGNPHQKYRPPSNYYHGSEAKYWYNTGYRDGFGDGNRYGFNNGYRTGYRHGDRNGYRRGTHDGYRWGYGDGYYDGHSDGYIRGSRRHYRYR